MVEKKICFFLLPVCDTSIIKKNIKFRSIDALAKNMYPVSVLPVFLLYS